MKKLLRLLLTVFICVAVAVGVNKIFETLDIGGYLTEKSFKSQNQEYNIDFQKEFGSKSMYYYNTLDEAEKEAYLNIYGLLMNFDVSFTLDVTKEQFDEIYNFVLLDNSEFFWVDKSYEYIDKEDYLVFKPKYIFAKDEAVNKQKEIEQQVEKILLEAEKYATPYEKELFFHDYLCENIVYDLSKIGEISAVYSAFIDGRTVCKGYAQAMQLLLDKSGIYNYLVIGDGVTDEGTDLHMWNVVKLDGKNYYVDVTWDDYESYDEPSRNYFNITDAVLSKDHKEYKPADNNCVSSDYNYFVKSGTYISEFQGFAKLADATANELKNGRLYVEYRFADLTAYNKAIKEIENNRVFFDFVEKSVKKSGKKLSSENISYFCDDKLLYICIVFKES